MRRIKGLSGGRPAVKLLWLFAALAIISGSIALLAQLFAEELFGWTPTVYRERREIDFARSISISSADIPLKVYSYSGDKIIVEYIGESALIIEEDELELKISRDENITLSLYNRAMLSYGMTVWLPAETYKELKLTSASGNIHARNIMAEFITINSRTGSINLYGTEGLIAVTTRYGDIRAEFINLTDACALDTERGNVEVVMPARLGVLLNFFTDTGSFTSDFFRRDYDNHKGDLYLSIGANPVRFTVRTGSGNLHFYKRDETVR
jgi:hypothetical protein